MLILCGFFVCWRTIKLIAQRTSMMQQSADYLDELKADAIVIQKPITKKMLQDAMILHYTCTIY